MPFSLFPHEYYSSIDAIDPLRLHAEGIRLLLLDLDNTIAPYHATEPSAALLAWLASVRAAGVEPFILSNSRKPTRVGDFAARANLPFVRHAGKPKRKGFRAAMEQMACAPAACAMVGDQIFTDILGARRSGLRAILVSPLQLDTLFRRLRFWVETPFRQRAKKAEFAQKQA